MESSESPEERAQRLLAGPRRPVVGILENIRSAGNVGSMFRSADATLMERLILCGYTAHPPHREIEKTALGSTESVPWEMWGSSVEAVDWLAASGYTVIALERSERSEALTELSPTAPMAFAVGNEAMGLSTQLLERCRVHAHLPMDGLKESLNVAVAFGVAAYLLRGHGDGIARERRSAAEAS